MRSLLFPLFTFCFFTGFTQTKLTLLLNRNGQETRIDSIKITPFSKDKGIIVPYKDSVTVSFGEKYADLYSVDYYVKGSSYYKWQYWLDTGTVTVKARLNPPGMVSSSLVIDTFINSPVTYAAKHFYSQLGDYRHRSDTVTLNNLLIESYKENSRNPFSFAIGRIYYTYNLNNIQRFREMNILEREQDKEIRKSIFYSIMLNERFRNSEKLFINYFERNVLLSPSGQTISYPFDRGRYNILFFAGSATTQAIAEFNALNSKWTEFDPKDFTFFIVYTSKDKDIWKPLFDKSSIPSFQLISEQSFLNETLFYPDTKFYIVDGRVQIPGFYDSFTDVSDHFKNR
jgi:hypothetical protein